MKTEKAIKKCNKWLAYCLNTGWDKSHLEGLEKLWWKFHDPSGNLLKVKPKIKIKCDNVHSFQNLIFALTGKELTT